MMLRSLIILIFLLFVNSAGICDTVQGFIGKNFKSSDGTSLPYRLFIPKNLKKGKVYPLAIHFHGAGSRGDNNTGQLYKAIVLSKDDVQENNPCFILAAQCPAKRKWVDLDWKKTKHKLPKKPTSEMAAGMELTKKIMKNYPIDTKRIYAYGQSMGGFAVWDIVSREPDMFAAAAPVCGGGDPKQAKKIKNISFWVCHGKEDPVVDVKNSQKMVKALKRYKAKVEYHEYPKVKHDAWNYAYDDKFIKWIFSQKKKQ